MCKVNKIAEANRSNTDGFIKKARLVHGDMFDYSLVSYISNLTPIKIKCKKHGVFEQPPAYHLRGSGCPICGKESQLEHLKIGEEEFLNRAKLKYNSTYDYTGIVYKTYNDNIDIRCRKHGLFTITPRAHLNDIGCPYCSGSRLHKQDFIERANRLHNNQYDYSKVTYNTLRDKIIVICKDHGEFSVTGKDHLKGSGCPKCTNYKGEMFVQRALDAHGISYQTQYKIYSNNRKYFVDFYINYNNTQFIIEFNGKQHYEAIDYFGGEEQFKRQLQRDSEVRQYCKDNNIKLFEIRYEF